MILGGGRSADRGGRAPVLCLKDDEEGRGERSWDWDCE